jgi:hypothetical protein
MSYLTLATGYLGGISTMAFIFWIADIMHYITYTPYWLGYLVEWGSIIVLLLLYGLIEDGIDE